MRRITFMALLAALVALVACSGNKQQNETKKMKTLVAYFSATGTTKAVAERLAKEADADLYEITPEQEYTAEDLDWHSETSRSSVEMKDKTSRPAIKLTLKDAEKYDVVYVGFPIWWYTAPTIINTFMDAYKFDGKVVIPFATSGGSTIDKAAGDLNEAYPSVNWKEGRLLNGATDEDLKAWVEENRKLLK